MLGWAFAHGTSLTPIGKLIDWFYLNSPGWAGIRARKRLIEELTGRALARTRDSGRAVRILDVAAGHGRYASWAPPCPRRPHRPLRQLISPCSAPGSDWSAG